MMNSSVIQNPICFFMEMADSPEEQVEELRDLWEFIKKRGLNKK